MKHTKQSIISKDGISYTLYSHYLLFCVMGICKRYYQSDGESIFQNLSDERY